MQNKKIFIIAGEASGDILGAGLMKALCKVRPDVEFIGVGGEEMEKAARFKSAFDMQDIAAMGFVEVLLRLPTIMARIRQTTAEILRTRPDLIITIDAPGFNMRVIERVRRKWPEAITVHYVAPQVWAWKEKRAAKVARLYDHLMCFFPFEANYFEPHGLATHVIGHSALEEARGNAARFRNAHGFGSSDTLITMLPGSRVAMTERLLPLFEKAAEILAEKIPDLRIAMPVVSTSQEFVAKHVKHWNVKPIILTRRQDRYDAFAASAAALAISGTAVFELALMGIPTVATYKSSFLSFFIAKRLVKIKYVTLPNILMDKQVVPELLQDAATPEALAEALLAFIKNKGAREKYLRDIGTLRKTLEANSGCDPSEAAAKIVTKILGGANG